MKVQRVRHPQSGHVSWFVLDDGYHPISPITAFLTYLEHIERSPHTIRSYAHHLKLYWEYLQDAGLDWKAAGLSELADFVSWLRSPQVRVVGMHEQEARRSEATINVILTAVTMFYEYHARLGTVEEIPLYRSQLQPHRRYKGFLHHISKGKPVRTRLIKLKAPQRMPQTLSTEQVTQLLAACQRRRDRFLVSLLYETGMRVGQALGLRHADIHSWDNVLYVVPRDDNSNGARAKTKDPYAIPVSADLMRLYADYLVYECDEIESDYVFVNLWEGERGRPLTYGSVVDLFRRLSRKTGVAVHPHMLRHTHATELLRSGWDPSLVQKRLGHAHIQTTMNTYTHLTDDDLKNAYHEYIEKVRKHRETNVHP